MNNLEKGLLYEKYVKDFIINNLGKNAYLWNECPENILIENLLINSHNDMRLLRKDIKEGHIHTHKDIGIDIIQIDNNNCSIIQCKNGYNNGLCVDDISGIMMRSNFLRDINTFIYYTSCLSRNIKYTANLSPFVEFIDYTNIKDKSLEFLTDKKIYFIKLPIEETVKDNIINDIIPFSYQLEAYNKFKIYFQTNNNGILSLPCGTGKTYTSYLISSQYNHIIILSPLKEFASQNLNRYIEYGYNKKTLLVDSDGDRDIDSIKKFIKNNEKFLISCTYNSMDLISQCLNLFKNALFIVDEFHNLSKANISDENNDIYKLLISNHKKLFMSATPRIYDIEYDDDNDIIDTNELFGDIVFQMTFTYAIDNSYITDYNIWLPSIHENNEELDKDLSIYEIDNEIKNRCKFLYSCIANTGSRKCIIYCKDTEDMKNMMLSMKKLDEFYIMDIEIYSISCEDNEKKRKERLKYFANNNKIQLLFNIKILNECIDIPSCDSIYISYAPKNKITTIQRISRATRIDKNNPFKIANIFIWCNEYEEILETLSSIKEYDIMFKDKIKINSIDFYHIKNSKNIEFIKKDKLLLCDYILGIKQFKIISWKEKLEHVKDYIINNNILPSTIDKNIKIKQLGRWLSKQKQYYKDKKYIMKDENIRILWDNFIKENSELFLSNKEQWKNNLELVKDYIKNNNKLPSENDKNIKIKQLGFWLSKQKQNYKNKKEIMKDENIRILWDNFIKEYYELFLSNEEKWINYLELVKDYIINNDKLPSQCDKNKDIKQLGKWLSQQRHNYKDKKNIMKNENIRILWDNFIKEYL